VFELNGMKGPRKKHLALDESNCTEGVFNKVVSLPVRRIENGRMGCGQFRE
jgi:hypothetical protein